MRRILLLFAIVAVMAAMAASPALAANNLDRKCNNARYYDHHERKCDKYWDRHYDDYPYWYYLGGYPYWRHW